MPRRKPTTKPVENVIAPTLSTPVQRRMETAEPFILSQHAKILSGVKCPWGEHHIMHIQWGHAWWHPQVFHSSGVDAQGRQWWKWRSLKPDETLPPSGERMDEMCKTTKQMAWVD
jgi:hypothetical protein